ncbi:MAG TPA: hypothetical protein VD970_17920 [Acetobacteraceae bacterium]|nr:hypothetical protein [Acetobacteraceae bacterium]
MRLRAWFETLLGRSGASGPAPVAAPPPPRPWHDEIAHAVLPYLLLTEAPQALDGQVPVEGALDLLYEVFEDIGQRQGLSFDEAMDAADATRFYRRAAGRLVVAIVAMPRPVTEGEAHFVGLGARPGEEPRCFVLDRAARGTELVEVTADRVRIPLGPGPEPGLEAFIAAIGAAGSH